MSRRPQHNQAWCLSLAKQALLQITQSYEQRRSRRDMYMAADRALRRIYEAELYGETKEDQQ